MTRTDQTGGGDAPLLLSTTRKMLELAEAGAWEALVDAEALRQPLMERVFGAGVAVDQAELAREILALDTKVMELAAKRRSDVQGLLQGMRANAKVQRQYEAMQALGDQP